MRPLASGEPFPWAGQFGSREAVDAYLAHDRLACLQCGLRFKMLCRHLVSRHGMTAADYKSLYAIPQTRGLSGSATRAARSTKAKQQFADNPPPVWASGGHKDVEGRHAAPQWVGLEGLERLDQSAVARVMRRASAKTEAPNEVGEQGIAVIGDGGKD